MLKLTINIVVMVNNRNLIDFMLYSVSVFVNFILVVLLTNNSLPENGSIVTITKLCRGTIKCIASDNVLMKLITHEKWITLFEIRLLFYQSQMLSIKLKIGQLNV